MFDMVDVNRDGRMSIAELLDFCKGNRGALAKMMDMGAAQAGDLGTILTGDGTDPEKTIACEDWSRYYACRIKELRGWEQARIVAERIQAHSQHSR